MVVALVAPDQRKDATKLARQVGLDVSLTDPDLDLLKKHLPDVAALPEAGAKAKHDAPKRESRGREAAKSARRSSGTRDTRIREAGPSSEDERPSSSAQHGTVRFYDARRASGS